MKRLFLLSTIFAITFIALTASAQRKLRITSENPQLGSYNRTIFKPLRIKLTDNNGNPLQGKKVKFQVMDGGNGVLENREATTNVHGAAWTKFTVGDNMLGQRVLAHHEYQQDGPSVQLSVVFVINVKRSFYHKFETFQESTISPIWLKFIGQNTDANVPDLIDHSYAGYENGRVGIPATYSYTVYDVTDYGAIPNDNQSDTQAIRDTLEAARAGNAIVFFPPGQYDVIMDGESTNGLIVKGDNIVVRGSGAAGAIKGGTTIKMHNHLGKAWSSYLFQTQWKATGDSTNVVGEFSKGTKSFDVENASVLNNAKYIRIKANGLKGADWDVHSSKRLNQMSDYYDEIKNGIDITEYHEIDSITGNTVVVKAPILTHLNSKFKIAKQELAVDVGFEDLHIDCNFQLDYKHSSKHGSDYTGHTGINLWFTAHSWVRRCRFSNVTHGVWIRQCYAATTTSCIFDGKRGHYTLAVGTSTYSLVGFIEDNTTGKDNKGGAHHGLSLSSHAVGTVMWYIGGEKIRGPDKHANMPRENLWDNYYSTNHETASGRIERLPHHLDGYTRWNNYVSPKNKTLDLWSNASYGFKVTQGNIIGHQAPFSISPPKNAYVEAYQDRVYPKSLYEAQLSRRSDVIEDWVSILKEDYLIFFDDVISGKTNHAPQFIDGETFDISISENSPTSEIIYVPAIQNREHDEVLTFSMSGDTTSFTIDTTNGNLSASKVFDFETDDTNYSIVLTVTDEASNQDSITLNIEITDIDEPTFDEGNTVSRSVDENALENSDIGLPVSATHQSALTYQLSGTDSDKFKVSADTGQIQVKTHMDYETQTQYSVIVTAADVRNSDNTASVDVTINVTDIVNDITPVVWRSTAIQDILKEVTSIADVNDITEGDLANVTDLDLEDADIAKLENGDFDGLSGLISLNLSGYGPVHLRNRITILPPYVFSQLQSLEKLVLSKNSISILPSIVFSQLTSLKVLELDDNLLETIPSNTFSNLSSLEDLHINNNSINRLPANVFNGLTSLKRLLIKHNELTTLSKRIFANISSLTKLHIENNQIRVLNKNLFRNLSSLETLYISDNDISTLDKDIFKGLPKLQYLKIHNNNLSSLPDGIFSHLTQNNNIVRLENNAVDPIPFSVSLEKVGNDKIKAVMPIGATFNIDIPLTIENGVIDKDDNILRIELGKTESETFSVTATNNNNISIDIESLPAIPTFPTIHNGYILRKSEDLPLVFSDAVAPAAITMPQKTALLANYPNPFNPETWIPYQLSQKSFVRINIYNQKGTLIRYIPLGIKPVGFYLNRNNAAYWDGRNNTGERVANGIYFYQLITNNKSIVNKMVIIK